MTNYHGFQIQKNREWTTLNSEEYPVPRRYLPLSSLCGIIRCSKAPSSPNSLGMSPAWHVFRNTNRETTAAATPTAVHVEAAVVESKTTHGHDWSAETFSAGCDNVACVKTRARSAPWSLVRSPLPPEIKPHHLSLYKVRHRC